jgi:hypothetical protein
METITGCPDKFSNPLPLLTARSQTADFFWLSVQKIDGAVMRQDKNRTSPASSPIANRWER